MKNRLRIDSKCSRIMQQLLQLELSLPFLNVWSAITLTNNLRICFHFALTFVSLPALPPSSTDLHGIKSARIRQQLPEDSFSWLRVFLL